MTVPGRVPLHLVVRDRRTATYGLNVVLGALAQERPWIESAVRVVATEAAAREAIAEGLRCADRVLVLWGFYSPDARAVFDEVGWLRAAQPDLRVTHLAGGPHASATAEATLRAGLDLVASADGEATLVAVADALVDGTPLAEVPGLCFLDGDGRFVSTGPPLRHDLDQFPPFAPTLQRYNPVEITRGCIYSCRFCQTPYLFKARFRHRSVDGVRHWVRHMRAEGMRYVRFVTPTALSYGTQTDEPDLDAVEALLAAVRQEMGPDGKVYFGSFPSEARPEHITPRAVQILRRYVDNDTLIIGAQSGSDAVLAASKRGHGVEEVERAVRTAVAGGFRCDVDFLWGLPGETPDDARASVVLAERLAALGARIHGHTFMPLPGTPFADADPGRLDTELRVDLERLAARGHLYGQWARQEQVAATLAPLVRRRATPGPSPRP